MHVLILGYMLVGALQLSMQPPQIDAKCRQSPFGLGTDNVPVGNGTATSVMNTWAFLEPNGSTGWLYKNNLGNHYFQLANKVSPKTAMLWGLDARFLHRLGSWSNYNPALVATNDIVNLENRLLVHGVVRIGCFSGDLRFQR